ncbi:ADPRH hydrolase, partial [Polyodon spathula]|nr:ADPRH hydrolase [Polyodon spathula]
GALRAICMGLRLPEPSQLEQLIVVSIYAVNLKPPEEWGQGLLHTLSAAKRHIEESGHCIEENLQAWDYFENKWINYLNEREILDGKSQAKFPPKEWSSSRHDAPMIAYNAILRAGSSWVSLAHHAFFHGGDRDSTAVIAACCWGVMYGFEGVPWRNHLTLEYRDRLAKLGESLYELSQETK